MSTIAGPHGPIPYRRGPLGYPRIQARSHEEVVWARGWFHAVDRLLQVRITLLAGQGRLQELAGDAGFARFADRLSRGVGLATGLEQEAASVTGRVRTLAEAYCAGFNAGMKRRGTPLIARLAGIPMDPFRITDMILINRTISWFGLASLTQVAKLGLAQLMAAGVSERALRLLLGPGAEQLDLDAVAQLRWPHDHVFEGLPVLRGSNAFAVSGARSTTGGALLMSEFHMEIARFPPIVHFSSSTLPGGEYFQGVSLPGVAGISAGRNHRVAWGYTFGHADQLDITIERCQGGRRRVGDDGWQELQKREEPIKIRGAKPETWIYYDGDGAVLLGDAGSEQEVSLPAVRWRGLHEAHVDLEVFTLQELSESVEASVELHRKIRCISVAGVFADDAGSIGWIQTGSVPASRSGWGPVPGGQPGETPSVPEDARPVSINPECGWIASANEPTEGWTAFPEAPYRHRRLVELLSRSEKVSPEDLIAASYDTFNPCAARLLPVWKPHLPKEPEVQQMLAWSGVGDDRSASRWFHALHHEMCHHLLAQELDSSAVEFIVGTSGMLITVQAQLDTTLALEAPDLLSEEQLAALIRDAWPAAKKRAEAGGLSAPVRTRFKNIFTQGKLPAFLKFSSKELDLPGGPDALFASRLTNFAGERIITGPAFHLLVDVSTPGVRLNVPGGASEKRLGPGYGRGVEAWLAGEFMTVEPESK